MQRPDRVDSASVGRSLRRARAWALIALGIAAAALAVASSSGAPPPPPSIAIDDVSASEGDGGTTAFDFTVSLSAPAPKPVSVDYATENGTATSPSDYLAASGRESYDAFGASTATTANALGRSHIVLGKTRRARPSSPYTIHG